MQFRVKMPGQPQSYNTKKPTEPNISPLTFTPTQLRPKELRPTILESRPLFNKGEKLERVCFCKYERAVGFCVIDKRFCVLEFSKCLFDDLGF